MRGDAHAADVIDGKEKATLISALAALGRRELERS